MSKLDRIYRNILLTKFFTKGWGHPENLKRIFDFRKILSDRAQCQHLVSSQYPIHIDKEDVQKECRILSGHFLSPFTEHLPGIMPEEVKTAKFEMVLPLEWKGPHKPVCIHLAGTGDHFFWRRRMLLARPLLKEAGIASIILENPYYGYRKPKQQLRSSLLNVSDLFVMGGALVLESLALLHWCEGQGLGPLGITGLSMGGHMASVAATNWTKPISCVPMLSWTTASVAFTEMASLAATNWHKPLSLIPCLSWSTASTVFTRGVLADAISWPLLGKQYQENSIYEKEVSLKIESPEWERQNPLYRLGHDFSTHYEELSESIISSSKTSWDPKPATAKPAAKSSTNSNSKRNMAERYLGPTLMKFLKLANKNQIEELKSDAALHFMRGVMDECTHLGNFSIPVDPSLVIIVAAKSDAYIPRDNVLSLQELWPGSELRLVDSGHISAFLFNQSVFRKAIIDSFEKQTEKYCQKDVCHG